MGFKTRCVLGHLIIAISICFRSERAVAAGTRLRPACRLVKRKALLRKLLAGVPRRHVLFVQDLPAKALLFHAMQGAGLTIEGVMAKRKDGIYRPGVRFEDWLKIKMPGWQDGRVWRDN